MDEFLRDIERRALRMAEFSTGNRDDGLEIVQEAMLGLVKRYSSRPANEWKPLFYRILQSRINDWHRRQKVRNRVMSVVHWVKGDEDDSPVDIVEQAPASYHSNPDDAIQLSLKTEVMIKAIGQLPKRQQQAFMLRAWEGLSVAQTAAAMTCSQGSVKTHYSRAVHTLRDKIEDED